MREPTVISFLSDVDTPVSMYHKISDLEPVSCLLESTDGDSRLARFSIIGVSPTKTLQFKDGTATLKHPQTGHEETFPVINPLTILQEYQEREKEQFDPGPLSKQYPFLGGWIGYMGYGATRYFDNIPQQEGDPQDVPDGFYALYDSVILFDHLYRRVTFVSYRETDKALALWESLKERLMEATSLAPLYYNADLPDEAIFDGVTGPFTEESFCERVLEAKSYILEGQVFQIVLAHRFSMPSTCAPIDVYRTLQAVNPSPYSYILKFPGFTYLGSSPETFVRCHNGEVILRALAGTRPRGKTDEEDLALATELKSNEKELAEHYMLVDLGRNDLGRVCQGGSIRVGEIATLTRYTHVMHLATELTGQLHPDKTAYDVFKSCFPRGTVSGAPKIRAMNLLSKLEPERRGVYSGVVGYFDHFGNMDGAIAIRSALIKDGVAHVNAGAGIVYDSDPYGEYMETRNKAKSMLKAVQLAERIGGHARLAHR